MLLVPAEMITSAEGRVMVIARVVSPSIVKEATEATGVKVDSVTPPVAERTPAGVNTTVPAVVPLQTVPKCRSTVFVIERGAIITADAVAVAVCNCANADAENANITTAIVRNFPKCFIF
jgi:hypothetical protein